MAEIIDFDYFKATGEKLSPKEIEDKIIEALPDIDVISSLMEMSTDELMVELHTRVHSGHSLRDFPTDILITELITRMSMIDLICMKASQMENNLE